MNKIVVVKGKDIVKRTEKALKKLKELPKGPKILIKPNLVEPMPKNSGAITRPEVVEGIIKYLKRIGKFEIIIGECCAYTGRTRECFEKAGYFYLEKKYKVKIVCFDENDFISVKLNGEKWKEIKVSKFALEADYIISAAVLKEHEFKVTLSLKNMMGILEPKGYYPNKSFMHKFYETNKTWAKRLCDLLKKFKPDLAVIDGTTAMYGSHLYGKLKRMDLTIVGNDALATDIFASKLLGHEKVFYLEEALKRGIGEKPEEIEELSCS